MNVYTDCALWNINDTRYKIKRNYLIKISYGWVIHNGLYFNEVTAHYISPISDCLKCKNSFRFIAGKPCDGYSNKL